MPFVELGPLPKISAGTAPQNQPNNLTGQNLFDESCQTITVVVPSSEHVSEIVGKKGSKIKSLRARTNTYIKTPMRCTKPEFVISGRPADIARARKEILEEADHFTYIRRHRHASASGMLGIMANAGQNPSSRPNANFGPKNLVAQASMEHPLFHHGLSEDATTNTASGNTCDVLSSASDLTSNGRNYITSFLKVPYNVVGLIVGPRGLTIKHIQERCGCYILTPNRTKDSVFEIYGPAANVKQVKEMIYNHLAENISEEEKYLLNDWDMDYGPRKAEKEPQLMPATSDKDLISHVMQETFKTVTKSLRASSWSGTSEEEEDLLHDGTFLNCQKMLLDLNIL